MRGTLRELRNHYCRYFEIGELVLNPALTVHLITDFFRLVAILPCRTGLSFVVKLLGTADSSGASRLPQVVKTTGGPNTLAWRLVLDQTQFGDRYIGIEWNQRKIRLSRGVQSQL